jgi:hypothetical protein
MTAAFLEAIASCGASWNPDISRLNRPQRTNLLLQQRLGPQNWPQIHGVEIKRQQVSQ